MNGREFVPGRASRKPVKSSIQSMRLLVSHLVGVGSYRMLREDLRRAAAAKDDKRQDHIPILLGFECAAYVECIVRHLPDEVFFPEVGAGYEVMSRVSKDGGFIVWNV
jgi:hypothetical protein